MYLELIYYTNNIEYRERINLSQKSNSLQNINEAEIKVVYQDQDYKMFLKDTKEVSNLSVLIDNNFVETNILYNKAEKGYDISFVNSPFGLIYGIIDIEITFEFNDEILSYYTPYLAVAIKENYKETMISVHDMLNEIFLKEHSLLQSKHQQNILNKKVTNKKENRLKTEIEFLKKIIVLLNQNYSNFTNMPKTIPIYVQEINDFEKLRQLNSATIQYIVQNPQELYKSNYGIKIKNDNYIPKKTLINSIYQSNDTKENRAVVSFINLLYSYSNSQINKIEEQLSLGIDNKLRNTVIKNGYIISFLIIEQYIEYSFKDYLKHLKEISNQLRKLLLIYKQNLIDTDEIMTHPPTPTATFLEVYHYRILYEHMVQWFSYTKPNIPNQNTVRHFHTADRIYEYYSLLNIIDIFEELGFKEDKTRRLSYLYDIKNYKYYISTCKYNTFFFDGRNGLQLVLYYQPVIYAKHSNKRNGISLFRTDYSRDYPYYTPDFIIKIKNGEKERYGILDAKWRNKNILKNKSGGFQDCVYKYYASVADERTLKPVSFMWLLQGKDDRNVTYYHQNSAISKNIGSSFVNSLGIVPFTPKSGNTELLKILNLLSIN